MYLQFVHLDSAFHLVVEVVQIVKILKMLKPGQREFHPVIIYNSNIKKIDRNSNINPSVLRPALKF